MAEFVTLTGPINLTLDGTTYVGRLSYHPEFKMLWLDQDLSERPSGHWSQRAISREEPYNADDDTVAILDTDGPESVVSQLVDLHVGTMVSESVLTPEYLPDTRLRILRINPQLLAAAT